MSTNLTSSLNKIESFSEILNTDLCSGCGLCECISKNGAINVSLNSEGFYRPLIQSDINLEDNETLLTTCPGIYIEGNNLDISVDTHDIWGQYISCYRGHSTDPIVRHNSSSGGGISGTLIYLLENGIVDEVLHIGEDIKNSVFSSMQISTTKDEVLEKAGSRYSPTSPLKYLNQLIDKNKKYAIVAKPCDIQAIKNVKRSDSTIFKNIILTISFFCAGTPSIKGTYELINQVGGIIDHIDSISYRGKGWPGYFYVKIKNSISRKINYEESWGRTLNKHIQFRCKICPDGTGEGADISFADAWELTNDGVPNFDELPGESLIITRTTLGNEIIKNAITTNYLIADDYSVGNIEKIQRHQALRKRTVFFRLLALKLHGMKIPRYHKMNLVKASIRTNPIILFKHFLKMFLYLRRAKRNGKQGTI